MPFHTGAGLCHGLGQPTPQGSPASAAMVEMCLCLCVCVSSCVQGCVCVHVSPYVYMIPPPGPPSSPSSGLSGSPMLPAPLTHPSRNRPCPGQLAPRVSTGRCMARGHPAQWAQRRCPGVQAGLTPLVVGGPVPETWPGGRGPAYRRQSVSSPAPHSPANSALTRGWSPAGRWRDTACPHTGSCHGC